MDRFPLGLTHTVVNSKKEKEVHPTLRAMPCVLLQALNDFIMEQGSSKSITLQVRTKQHPNQGHVLLLQTFSHQDVLFLNRAGYFLQTDRKTLYFGLCILDTANTCGNPPCYPF